MQTRLMSTIEVVTGLILGLLLSIFVVQPLVFDIYHISLSHGDNTIIAVIFTLVSLVRGLLVRRFFNYINNRSIS